MEQTKGYKTITYRFRLYCDKEEWLIKTKKVYNEVLQFYYEILMLEPDLAVMGNMHLMRELELLTIGSKTDQQTKYPITFGKVPLYFRRAAINDAIRLYRSFQSGKEHGANQAKCFQTSPVYYKGMYKDLTEESVQLKLFNGEQWCWVPCRIDSCGRKISETDKFLSPILKVSAKKTMLHVPVQKQVQDIRTVKERLEAKETICAVSFPSNDCMAVVVHLSAEGKFLESRFIRGGKELSHRRKLLLNQIQKNREQMHSDVMLPSPEENKRLKEKIHRITENAAHKVSREIVDFCKSRNAAIVVLPNYKNTLDFNRMGYLSATNYDWLGRRIISYVRYKAFKEGIVPASVSVKNISAKCYLCGATVKKYNATSTPGVNYYGGKNFVCPNGHRGNSNFNSAMNIGQNFLNGRYECCLDSSEKSGK